MENRERWEALAALLLRQRVTVLGERSRAAFARKVGVSDSVLAHLESAKRDNYDIGTLLSLEAWYQLTPEQLHEALGDRYPMHHEMTTTVGDHVVTSSRENGDETLEQLQASVEAVTVVLEGIRRDIQRLKG